MLLWRSFWAFFDMVFITDLSLILSFTLTTLVFVGFACFNTLNGVPASVELDWMAEKEYCTVSTLMQVLSLFFANQDNKEPKLKSDDQASLYLEVIILDFRQILASPCPIHAICVPILHIFQFNWNVASKEKH